MWRLKGLLGSTRRYIKRSTGLALLILSNRDMEIIKRKEKFYEVSTFY